ncbi:hypothetical protein C8R43DRAFT_1125637 [Mycena crocata]|nr:hypothetical protein C8R43DRAFT_1125637 [Mycena crocata]
MLEHISSLGPMAIANAEYGIDFMALRERSVNTGSLYLFKAIPDVLTDGARRKVRVCDYVGHIFGEVDAVFEAVTGGGTYIRVKCPTNASCAVKNLYHKQLLLLRSVLDTDDENADGDLSSNWFDCVKLREDMGRVEGCFYMTVRFYSPSIVSIVQLTYVAGMEETSALLV